MYYDRPRKKEREDTRAPSRRFRGILFRSKAKNQRRVVRRRRPAPARTVPRRKEPKASWLRRHPLIGLFTVLLVVSAISVFSLYALPLDFFGSHSQAQYSAANLLPSGYTNVLLLGIDADSANTSRSDTMIVLSLGKDRACLTSFMRDTGVNIPGRTGTQRLNAAYAYGGADLVLKTVNENFGLDITRYVLVDYESFPKLIDMLGGIVLSVTDSEAKQVNDNMAEVINRSYKRGDITYDEAWAIYNKNELLSGGENLLLSGDQALGYARIRKLDSDYGRTNRQRKVLSAAMEKLKGCKYRPVQLVSCALTAFDSIQTNMSTLEILSLGLKALNVRSIELYRLPENGTYVDNGSMFRDVDFRANHNSFIANVYGATP